MATFWAVNATACVTAYVPPSQRGPARQETAWAAYLGTPRHDASAAESLGSDPRPLWRTHVGRAVRGSPAIGEAVIVAGTADRIVALVDRGTGQALWRSRVSGTINGGPLFEADRVYVATEATPEARVYALRLRNGQALWSTKTESIAAPLALDADTLYTASETGLVLRLDTDQGKIVWRRRLSGAVRAAPVPTAAGIAVATTADTVYLLDRATGQVRARLPTPGSVLAGPATDGVRLYLGTTAGRVLAIDLAAFAVAWDVPAGDAVLGALAVAGDTVYALARNGTLLLIPRAAPSDARSFALGIVALAGPTPLASGVLVAGTNGAVLLVDRTSGAVLWRMQLDGPIEQPPLVRERQLVVVSGRGDILSYR